MAREEQSAECIFCRIASGEIPATIVYQDELVVAFRDVNPQAPTHVLVIPREHVPSLNAVSEQDKDSIGHIVRVSAQIAEAEGCADTGYRLVANCGPEAGQSVDHVHFHLLAGRRLGWPPG
ncbi:MAG: histidine triad nucleotide-binding protein [Armatimonadota bacterium]|nr:MAG: histidine triad nucleotide-binding protein [Armatimonadota bacterium]